MNPFSYLLARVKTITPAGEPALLVSYTLAALTALLGCLVTHHVIPSTLALSPDLQQFLPIAAAGLVASAGHFIRPLVTPVSRALESKLSPADQAWLQSVIFGLVGDLTSSSSSSGAHAADPSAPVLGAPVLAPEPTVPDPVPATAAPVP